MARRQRGLTPEEQKRARRVLVALIIAAALVLVVVFIAWAPWERPGGQPGDGEHEHRAAPHGGTLTSLGLGEPHDHAEALLELGGSLTVYTLKPDAKASRAVGRQIVAAWVRAAAREQPAKVMLVPMPREDDPPGTTSRFKGRLAEALWGLDLSVTVSALLIEGSRYRVEFAEVKTPGGLAEHQAEQKRLFLTPGGKYAQADIEANGKTTAARKFADDEPAHDFSPEKEGWLCPVALTRSEPGLAWAVGGRDYRFCCSPCVDEFVRLAKEQPDRIKTPDAYWKR